MSYCTRAPRTFGPVALHLVLGLALVAACQAREPGPAVGQNTRPDTAEQVDPEIQKQAQIDAEYDGFKRGFPGVPEMTAATLKLRLAEPDPPVLVDVRSGWERGVSMLPGAISREQFEAQAQRFAGRQVVAYCAIGSRSGRYTQMLKNAGWDAFNLRGAILAWTHVGGDLVQEDGSPTKRVSVGTRGGLVARGYEAAW